MYCITVIVDEVYNLYDLQCVAVQRRVPDTDNADRGTLVVVYEIVPKPTSFSFAPMRWTCGVRQDSGRVSALAYRGKLQRLQASFTRAHTIPVNNGRP